MGNIFSSSIEEKESHIKKLAKNSPLYETIDFIATQYILTMDFKSMQKLHEKDYCDSLIVLTSSIIDRHVGIIDIKQISQRLDSGGEPVIFLKKEASDAPDFKNKQRMCNKIAKYYVKIAHLFSAIVHTINPTYTYIDTMGNEISVPLSEKDTIPDNVKISVEKLNLCGSRASILAKKEKQMTSSDVCSIHLSEGNETLDKEYGIPELMELYYDADYNYKNGTFSGMKPETSVQFKKDLSLFYREFTGNSGELPHTIKKFSDIKMRDYCKIHTNFVEKEHYERDVLLLEYASNLREMLHSVNEGHKKLLEIINTIFIEVDDETAVRINPELNEKKLQELIERTRDIIVSLYLQCERDFVRGLHIYEAVIDSQVLETTQKQIESLEEAKQLLYG